VGTCKRAAKEFHFETHATSNKCSFIKEKVEFWKLYTMIRTLNDSSYDPFKTHCGVPQERTLSTILVMENGRMKPLKCLHK